MFGVYRFRINVKYFVFYTKRNYSNIHTVKRSRMTTLETLNFDNLVIKRLPIDPVETNYVRTVANSCFSRVDLSPVERPVTVAYSLSALKLLDVEESEAQREDFCEYFSGSKLLKGSQPSAHCYCGHQFGYFSGQLGDGAAMYVGEVVNVKGERWELQLKGAGKTPYSRQADGRKVLRSSIREFICSEAMYHLGIPTTRAGSCITSDSKVIRDVFYDGHPIAERCTVVSRIAPTFLRFGSFEIFKTMDQFTGRVGPSVGRTDLLHQMLEYSIETFFPQIHSRNVSHTEKYMSFFEDVVLRTARLVAEWQCVGFCHGVLNTDNMSILGLTIDYGPFGFMDRYDPDHICNASDDGGRYTFIKQPEICLWNLRKFAEAIQSALPLADSLPLLDLYQPEFDRHYISKMRKKLGLIRTEFEEDKELIDSFHNTMEETGADFTNSFRNLSHLVLPGLEKHEQSLSELKRKMLEQCYPLDVLIKANQANMDARQFQMFLLLMQSNPELLEQLGKGMQAMERVLARMERSKNLQKLKPKEKSMKDNELWDKWLKQYKKRLEKEVSDVTDPNILKELQIQREEIMNNNNPRIVFRNHIAENAIREAEKGNYEEVKRVLKLLENPYAHHIEFDDLHLSQNVGGAVSDESNENAVSSSHSEQLSISDDFYNGKPPDWAMDLRVT